MANVLVEAVKKIGIKAGLSEEDVDAMLSDDQHPEIDFNDQLPGQAESMLEVFLAEVGGEEMLEDSEGVLWAPMIRTGQFAVRPGPRGQKVRRPLKIVAGRSEDPLKQIGLTDLKEAFEDDAVEHVTVPTSHNNTTLENTGFIRGMKIMDAPITSGPKKGEKVPTLFGGYDFTEPDVKGKVKRGTIPSRSCGILYNYVNTETGKTYKSVVEHVALTSKAWIRGMLPFGRKVAFSEGVTEPESLVLADELPEGVDEVDPPVTAELADENLATAEATVTWTHEDSPNWLRQQVEEILRQARAEKTKARRNNGGGVLEESVPWYRCVEAKSTGDKNGKALISDGYGEGANHWVAGVTIDDGQVELDDFSKWQAVKSVYVSDDRDPPAKKNEPLAEQQSAKRDTDPRALLADAHNRRRSRLSDAQNINSGSPVPGRQIPTPPGGEVVATSGASTQHELSEDAQERIRRAEEEARAANERADRLSEQVERQRVEGQKSKAASIVNRVKAMGLDESRGFSGMLVQLSNVLKADDGDAAVVGECFSEDGKTEVSLSLTEAFERVFDAIETGEDGKAKLGEQLAEPSSTEKGGEESKEGEGGTEVSEDGKPAAEGEPKEDFSLEGGQDRARKSVESNPELAAITGGVEAFGEPKAEEKKDGGESK